MRRNRRVKILATLGPASSTREVIAELFRAGADVFRINMSHTDHATLRSLVATSAPSKSEFGRPIGILADLQGPKQRIGKFAAGKIELQAGARITFDSDPAPGNAARVCLPHPEILSAIKPGDRLLLDDGRVRLKAVSASPKSVTAEVVSGTMLSDRKGVSLPDTEMPPAP